MASERLLRGALVAALALGAGCTETDDDLVDEISVTRLLLIAPDLEPQAVVNVEEGEETFQLATWVVEQATLDLDETALDPLFGETCAFTDTASASPTILGACSGGLVIDVTEEAVPIRLSLTFTMQVSRADPAKLTYDNDDVPADDGDLTDDPCTGGVSVDCDDNCPLVDNDDQADADGNGTGDDCTGILDVSGVQFEALDSDGDGVVDSVDNCVWYRNPEQSGLDPIGDDCEQTADVRSADTDSLTIILDLPPDELLSFEDIGSFVTVDFDVTSLVCSWGEAKCTLASAGVTLCGRSTSSSALGGC